MTLKHLLYSATLSVLIISSVPAQSPSAQDPAGTEQEQQHQQEIEKKALALLDDVIRQASALRRAENRLRIQTTAADLLWTRDEQRARSLYKEATSSLGELMSSISSADPQFHNLIQPLAQLRQEVLRQMAGHDAQLALEFLRATRQPRPPQADPSYKQSDPERQLEMSLASQIAANDPKQALEIAEKSLAKGISYQAVDLFRQLQMKDRDAAGKLAGDIITKLHSEDLAHNQEAANVALNLMQIGSQSPAIIYRPGQNSPQSESAPPVIDQQSVRDLIDMAATAALSSSPSSHNLLMQLRSMMPLVEKYSPERALTLRRRYTEFDKTVDVRTRAWNEYQKLIQEGTVDTLLAAIDKAPPEIRNSLYQQAAWKALNQGGDADRARQIINDHITDPNQRNQMLLQIDRQSAELAANQGKLDEARQALSRLSSDEERANMLVQLATTTAARGDQKAALQLLNEARSLIGDRPRNSNQFNAQLQVASAYAQLDPARSFEIVEPLIEQVNEMIAAGEVLDGFLYSAQSFRDGELLLQAYGGPINSLYFRYANELTLLARIDFDRAKSVADRFQRSEAQAMARLFVAQGVLSGQPAAGGNSVRPGAVLSR